MMPIQFGPTKIGGMQYNGVTIGEAMYNGQTVYRSLPVVQITGTSGVVSRDQFRQACIDYGTTYNAVQVLPFRLDTTQATNLSNLFNACYSLTSVPDMDTANVTDMSQMFMACVALTSAPRLDTTNVTRMGYMFNSCYSLTSVPDMNTANVTRMDYMYAACSLLTDGNTRLIGRHPSVVTTGMINGTGLTREPFYDANGNPI